MKRRRFVKGLLALPAAPAIAAQQPAPQGTPASAPTPQPAAENPVLEITVADFAAHMAPKFFNAPQFAALKRLSEILVPPYNGSPGAIDAHAPEFLDFLIGQSPADRQQNYRAGLDALNAQAKKQFKKSFAELDVSQAHALLSPLREPWTPEPPDDSLARFLRSAKQDVARATANSPEWSAASQSTGGRRPGGFNPYWLPID